MGSVDVAIEEGGDGTRRIVALKRLLPDSARDPRRKAMFLSEARLAALLAHPNVVRALAFGELGDELFLAMEYVEGQTLSRVIAAPVNAGEGLDPRLVAYILADVCDGLHAAHELRDEGGYPLNVVHRDVSPHNVMIAYDGHVKILDFGVAKFDAARNQTRTGEVKGKMAYMSPEQALGEALDRRSDLFGIGAVLYECIVGRPMWGTGTDLEVMRKLALEQPPRLEHARREVPPALAALHARLVARDPAKRPASARLVAEDLRAVATDIDRAGMRGWMESMFAVDAAERRTAVARAVEAVDPDRVHELRPSLTEAPVAVPKIGSAPRAGRKTRRVVVGGALTAGLLGALALVAFANAPARPAPSRASASTEPARAAPSGVEEAPAPVLGPLPADVRTSPDPEAHDAAGADLATSTRRSGALGPATPHRTVTDRPAPKLPDVDPTPF
jgi:hypothetical protein